MGLRSAKYWGSDYDGRAMSIRGRKSPIGSSGLRSPGKAWSCAGRGLLVSIDLKSGALLCAFVLALFLLGADVSQAGTVTFTASTAGETPFKVPAGVSSVAIVAQGQPGATGLSNGFGGAAAQASGSLDVSGGQMLYLEVAIDGGAPGGGLAGAGGGSSELRLCSVSLGALGNCSVTGPGTTSLDSQVLVAAGGGGGGSDAPGTLGDGGDGGPAGIIGVNSGDGADGQTKDSGGGHGGTAGGGAGGTGDTPGGAGGRGQGGAGGDGFAQGGGGGSGFWGGGGAGGFGNTGNGGGGGGGMSFARTVGLPDALVDTTISGAAGAAASASPRVQLTYTDSTPPSVSLDPLPAHVGGRPTFSGHAGTDTGDSQSVTVTLHPSGGGADQILTTNRDSGGAWTVTPSSPLPADPNYSVTAGQSDNAGNTAATSPVALDVDPAAPAVTLDQPANGLITSNAAPVISGTAGNKAKDQSEVTVLIYAGTSASGTPVRTLHATRSGSSYSVAVGAALPDGTYSVVASQSDNGLGVGTTPRNSFTVDTRPPTVGISPPTRAAISGLSETNKVFAVGSASTPLTGRTAAKRHKKGTVFSFRLDQPATVEIAIQVRARGRRVGRTCRPDSRRLRRRPPCTRTVTLASLTRTGHAGRNKVAFSGRLRGKALKSGRYQAAFTARDPGGTSTAKTLAFTIVKR